jgi:hypothetical protein
MVFFSNPASTRRERMAVKMKTHQLKMKRATTQVKNYFIVSDDTGALLYFSALL